MFKTIVTPEDLLKGEIIKPGWHPFEFVDYKEEEAGTDKSTNLILTFRVIDGGDKGKTAQPRFNEKALGFGKDLWALIIPGWDKVKGGELSSEIIKQQLGKKVRGFVETGKSTKGNEFNNIKEFMPLV